MSGFVGWYNNHRNLKDQEKNIKKMNDTLSHRGQDAEGYYIDDHMLLGHKRMAIIDLETGGRPICFENYTICYNGEIYNAVDLKNKLLAAGFKFETNCDTEIVLKGYICYKEKILEMLEGMYAFAIYDGNDVFLGRDRLGMKPLFYTTVDDNFLFASEIKALLACPLVDAIIDIQGLTEILALGPSRIPGSGIFKNIYELKPAHYLKFKNKIEETRYWQIENKDFNDSFDECTNKIRHLLEGAIKRQMVSNTNIGTLLSGGLDSSIITAVCAQEYQKKGQTLNTYSVDYEGNEEFFSGNDYQVSRDNDYIDLVRIKYRTNHTNIVLTQEELAEALRVAVIARDLPGMADIDSSLYVFSKKIRANEKVVLSGEGADEIFGGYPWFFKAPKVDNFPWIKNLEERTSLLNEKIKQKMDLEQFSKDHYLKTINDIPKSDDEIEQYYRNLIYLCMNWFGLTLFERKDRMTMSANLEARAPFADHHLIEYLWSIPWDYKAKNGQEKGLLREAFKELLPSEIINRKKNPYPKTHNPKYAKIVSELLRARLNNKDSIIYQIFDINKINELIETAGESYKLPWFGQLMTGPQLIAFIYQIDIWAEIYKIKFVL